MFKYGIMKTSWCTNFKEKDYEMYPEIFIGECQPATALKAEKRINELLDTYLRNHPSATYDPVGIHHWGCDEVFVNNGEMNFLYKVVQINDKC